MKLKSVIKPDSDFFKKDKKEMKKKKKKKKFCLGTKKVE